jgi:hypothetical protein
VRQDEGSDADRHDPVTEAPREPGRLEAALRRHYTRTRAVVAGVAAAAITGFALLEGVFNLFPGFRPDEPCARVQDVTLAEPTLDRLVTRREALERQGASLEGIPAERLAQPGKFVSLEIKAIGYEDKPLEVFTWVLTADGAPVRQPDPEFSNYLVQEWPPDGCEDSTRVQVWTPVPASAGQYLIQVQVRPAGSREVLEESRTQVFAVDAATS